MARPHIEFVQSQALPWRTLPDTAARPGVGCKVLSRDGDTGAVSVILRYPSRDGRLPTLTPLMPTRSSSFWPARLAIGETILWAV